MSAARDMTVVLRLRADGTAEVVGAAKAVANAVSGTGTAAAEAGAQMSQASTTAAQAQRDAAAAAGLAGRANREAAAAAESEAAAIARFRQMLDPASAALQAVTAETERYATWASQARINDNDRVAGLAMLAERMGLSSEAAARLAQATAALDAQVASGGKTAEDRAGEVERMWRAEQQAATAAAEAANRFAVALRTSAAAALEEADAEKARSAALISSLQAQISVEDLRLAALRATGRTADTQALSTMTDQLSASIRALSAAEQMEATARSAVSAESARLAASYQQIVAQVDPAIAAQQRFDQALADLRAAAAAAGISTEQLAADELKLAAALSPAAQAAADKAAALQRLRDKLDPTAASMRTLWAEAAQVKQWFDDGELSAAEYSTYLTQLQQRMAGLNAEEAKAGSTRPWWMQGNVLRNWLDVGQMALATGSLTSALPALIDAADVTTYYYGQANKAGAAAQGMGSAVEKAGAQAAGSSAEMEALAAGTAAAAHANDNAAASTSGLVGFLKDHWKSLLLVSAGLAAVAAGTWLVLSRASDLKSQLRDLTGTALAVNSAFSGAELQDMANAMSQASKYTRDETTAALEELVKFRDLSKEVITDIAAVMADYATATKRDLSSAGQALAEAMANGYAGVKQLEKAYGPLSVGQRKTIAGLYDQGKASEAAHIALTALAGQMKVAADTMVSDWDRAMRDLANAWNTALDDMAKSPKVQALLAVAKYFAKGVSDIAKNGLVPATSNDQKWDLLNIALDDAYDRKRTAKSQDDVRRIDKQIEGLKRELDNLRATEMKTATAETSPKEQYGPTKSDYDQSQRVQKSIQDMRAETDKYTRAMAGGREEREKALLQMEAEVKVRDGVWTKAEAEVWVTGELKKKKADLAAAAGDAAAASSVETRAAERTAAAYAQSEAAGLAYATMGEKLAEAHQSQYGTAWALAQAQESLSQRYAKAAGDGAAYIASLDRQLSQEQALAAAAGQGGAAEAQATNAITAQAQVREQLLALDAARLVLDERHAAGQVTELEYQAQILTYEQQRQGIETSRETILARLNSITAVQTLKSINQQNAALETQIQALQVEGTLLFATQGTREKVLALASLQATYQKEIAAATGDEKVKLQTAYERAVMLTNQYYTGKIALDQVTKSAEALKSAGEEIGRAFQTFFSDIKKDGENAFKSLATTIANTLDNLTGTLTYNAIINLITSSSSSTGTATTSSGNTATSSGATSGATSTYSTVSTAVTAASVTSALAGGSGSTAAGTIATYVGGIAEEVAGIGQEVGTFIIDGMDLMNSASGLIAGWVGGTASSLIWGWDSEEEQIGSSIGSTVGTFIGYALGGWIGAGIGSFLGDTIGGWIGSLLEDVDEPEMGFGLAATAGGDAYSGGAWALDGIEQSEADAVMTETVDALNTLIDAIGGVWGANPETDAYSMWALGYNAEDDQGYFYRDGTTQTDVGGYDSYDTAFIGMVEALINSGELGVLADEVYTVVASSMTESAEEFANQLQLAANWDSLISTLSGATIDYLDYVETTAAETIDAYQQELQTYQDLAVGGGLDVTALNDAYIIAIERMLGVIDGSVDDMTEGELLYLENIALITGSTALLEQAGMDAAAALDVVSEALATYKATAVSDYVDEINAAIEQYQGKSYIADAQGILDSLDAYYSYAEAIGGGTDELDALRSEAFQSLIDNADNAAVAVNDLAAAYPDYVDQIWAAYDAVTGTGYAIAQASLLAGINGLSGGYATGFADLLADAGVTAAELGDTATSLEAVFASLTGGAADIATLTAAVDDLFTSAIDSGTITLDQVESIVGDLIGLSSDYWTAMQDLASSSVDLLERAYTAAGDSLTAALLSFDYAAAVDRQTFVDAGGDGAAYDAVVAVERILTELDVYSSFITDLISSNQELIDEYQPLIDALSALSDTAAGLRLDDSLSTGSLYDLMLEARSQYVDALVQAQDTGLSAADRETAASTIDSLVSTYLGYAHDYYGSTTDYVALFNQTQTELLGLSGEVASGLQDQVDYWQEDIDSLDDLQSAIDAATAATAMGFDSLESAVTTAIGALATAQADLSGILSGFAAEVVVLASNVGVDLSAAAGATPTTDSTTTGGTATDTATTGGTTDTTTGAGFIDYPKLIKAAYGAMFPTYTPSDKDISAWDGYLRAGNSLADMLSSWTSMAERYDWAYQSVDAQALLSAFGYRDGGRIPAYASGGLILNGVHGVDSVLATTPAGVAALAGGEYIMPTAATTRYYPVLEAMRAGTWSGTAYGSGGSVGGGPVGLPVPANDPVDHDHFWGPAGGGANDDGGMAGGGPAGRDESDETVLLKEQNDLLRQLLRLQAGTADSAAVQRDETNRLLGEQGKAALLDGARPKRRAKG